MTYVGCPFSWDSKMQTQVALSTMEAEYITLSTALREQIHFLELVKEVIQENIDIKFQHPIIHCKAFEDNSGALEMAKLPKILALNKTS